MNRTDRLYALVEELRAVAPRTRSARWLAERLEVSTRTVERDLSALQQSGVPIWADTGRRGGYALDPAATLPPLALTVDEAVAVTIGLEQLRRGPYGDAALSALRKLRAVAPEARGRGAADVLATVRLLEPATGAPTALDDAVRRAVRDRRVLRIGYRDKGSRDTTRDVEPLGWVVRGGEWYLLAWCRLRDAVRAFKVERIGVATVTDVPAPTRDVPPEQLQVPYGVLRALGDVT